MALQGLLFLFVAVLMFGGRWYREVQERVEYFQHVQNLKKIREMKEEMKTKTKKTGGSTAVEEIVTMLKKVENLIAHVFELTHNQELREAQTILTQSLQRLAASDDLYSVKFDHLEEDQRKSIMQVVNAFSEPQVSAKHQKSVRFGKSDMSRNNSRLVSKVPSSGVGGSAAIRSSRSAGSRRLGTLAAMMYEPDEEMIAEMKLLKSSTQCALPTLLLSGEIKGDVGRTWEYDLLGLSKRTDIILMEVGHVLLEDKMELMGATDNTLRNLLYSMQQLYFPNPYHNATHAACVAHCTASLTKLLDIESEFFDTVAEVTLIVSSLSHDIGHPGRNNAFYVNTFHPLAVMYNDASVLENFHSTVTFNVIGKPQNNIFSALMPDTFRQCRNRIIELILATDMKHHFEGISRFRVRRNSPEFDIRQNPEDLWLLLRMCIKAGDLAHAALDWNQHLEWSFGVVEEFYKQGEEEARFGLPKSPLCDRDMHDGFAKSQKGFIEFVVQPLFTELDETSQVERVS